MNLSSIDLNLLLVFEAIDDARSVSKAAERLGLRQPAVSAALGRLRIAFGDELFVRAAGAMQPTAEALRIGPGIAAALGELRTTLAAAAPFSPGESDRTFVVASTDYTTLVILPGLIEAIGRQAPGIDLRIIGYDKDDVPDLIDRGEIDVALGFFQSPPQRAVRQMLCPERFVGLARTDHPLLGTGTLSLEQYAAAEHALVTVRRDVLGELDIALRRHGLSRRVALTLPHMLALPHVIARSDLLAAVPGRVAALFAGEGLRTFEIPLGLPGWRIEMLWNPGARSDRASAWLRSNIATAASRTMTSGTSGRP